MRDDFQAGGPITAERAQAATEWIIHNATALAEAKADKEKAENMLKVVKALAMKASGETAVSAQEREACASLDYQEAVQDIWEATLLFEKLSATNKAAMTVIDVWRSLNSTLKGSRV